MFLDVFISAMHVTQKNYLSFRPRRNISSNNFFSTGNHYNNIPTPSTTTPTFFISQSHHHPSLVHRNPTGRSGRSRPSSNSNGSWRLPGRWPSSMFRRLRNIYMVNHLEKIIYLFSFSLSFTFIFAKKESKNWFSFFSFFLMKKIYFADAVYFWYGFLFNFFAAADLLLPLYSSDEICDGIKNCPGGEDEDPRKCPGIPFIFAFLFIYFNLFFSEACFYLLWKYILLLLLFRVFAWLAVIQFFCMISQHSQQSKVNVFTEEW